MEAFLPSQLRQQLQKLENPQNNAPIDTAMPVYNRDVRIQVTTLITPAAAACRFQQPQPSHSIRPHADEVQTPPEAHKTYLLTPPEPSDSIVRFADEVRRSALARGQKSPDDDVVLLKRM